MKINYRLLLITFGIIVVISITSTLIFFSLTTSILESKLSNSFTKNSYDFAFKLQNELDELDEEFHWLYSSNADLYSIKIDTTSLDLILPVDNNLLIDKERMNFSSKSYLNFSSFEIRKFIANNPNILLNYIVDENGTTYYGRIINDEFLQELSEITRVDIALIVNDVPNISSNSFFVNQYLTTILEATKFLTNKNNFSLFAAELESVDFYAAVYISDNIYLNENKVKFLLFSTTSEIYEVRETMGMIMLILITAGAALSLVFVMLFTTKLRKQISLLSKAAAYASKGEFNQKVTVISRDEIGKLAIVFNQMLAELRNKEKREKEYSEFLTLLNQNPTLDEIAEESLKTIIKELGLDIGAFYVLEENKISLIKTVGEMTSEFTSFLDEQRVKEVTKDRKPQEFVLEYHKAKLMQFSEILSIEYAIIFPIVYQNNVIAILELAGEKSPAISTKEYMEIIHDQMAVGISNASIFARLERLVVELRELNEQYQNQNKKITEKNEQLVKLHSQLRQKADELEQEKSKALELTSLKSQFLASISHELRTPLNSIIGLSELVMEKAELDKESHKRMSVVLRSGKRLLALINNILEFLKIETGKVTVNKESFLLSALLKEIENIFEPQVKEKKLKFEIQYDITTDLLLVSDRQKLEQVLINLVGNAIKFTSKGGVQLRVALLGAHELSLKVIDSGIGIKEEDLELIFQEFRQGDGSTRRRYEGTGLGLAISKEYSRLLGGELYCDSQIGKGSEFTVLLKSIAIEKIDTYEPITFTKNIEDKEVTLDERKNSTNILLLSGVREEKFITDYMTLNHFNVVQVGNVTEIKNECSSQEYVGIIILDDESCSYLKSIKTLKSDL